MARSTHVGTPQDALADIAWRIKQHVGRSIQVVWLAEDGTVYVASIEAAPGVSPENFVGSYSAITQLEDIEEDLREAQAQRATNRRYVSDKAG